MRKKPLIIKKLFVPSSTFLLRENFSCGSGKNKGLLGKRS